MASVRAKAIIEVGANKIDVDEVTAKVKQRWAASGKLVKDIKSLELYIKPADNKVYPVINGAESESVDL